MDDILYLTLENVLAIHEAVLEEHGGADGLLSRELLESAVEMPKSSFGGEDLYPDILDKAAACLFFIAGNHAFRDGNKRTGLAAALTFLALNGTEIILTEEGWPEMESLVLGIASGTVDRPQATGRFSDILARFGQA
jgi:death-on-curing protein